MHWFEDENFVKHLKDFRNRITEFYVEINEAILNYEDNLS